MGGLYDCLGVLVPSGYAACDEVVSSEGELCPVLLLVLSDDLSGDVCNQGGGCRGAVLISNNAQTVTFSGQTEHGFCEVAAMSAKDPTGSKNKVVSSAFLQCNYQQADQGGADEAGAAGDKDGFHGRVSK